MVKGQVVTILSCPGQSLCYNYLPLLCSIKGPQAIVKDWVWLGG